MSASFDDFEYFENLGPARADAAVREENMKKELDMEGNFRKMKTILLALAFLLLAPCIAQALTVAEIMAPEFGMREDVVRLYDEIVANSGNIPGEEIKKALERKDELIEKTNRPAFSGNEARHIAVGKDLVSICMVGMYLADRHFMQNEKLYDKYVDEFMPGLLYATYLLGASGTKFSDEKRQEIGDKIYAPLLNVLAAHAQ